MGATRRRCARTRKLFNRFSAFSSRSAVGLVRRRPQQFSEPALESVTRCCSMQRSGQLTSCRPRESLEFSRAKCAAAAFAFLDHGCRLKFDSPSGRSNTLISKNTHPPSPPPQRFPFSPFSGGSRPSLILRVACGERDYQQSGLNQ